MNTRTRWSLWLTEASSSERRGLAVGVAGLLALLVWSLLPVADGEGQALSSGDPAGSSTRGGDQAPVVVPTSGPTTPGRPSQLPGPGNLGTTGGTVGPTGPTSNASGPSNPGGTGGGGTSGTSGGGTTGSVPLTATDRGVSATAIKLGISVSSTGTTNSLGFTTGTRTDIAKVADALVADYNRKGGVVGRKIDAVKLNVDPLSTDDQRSKCIDFTEKYKVFAVVDGVDYSATSTRQCITREHKTTLVAWQSAPRAEFTSSAPYLVSTGSDFETRLADAVGYYKSTGVFKAKGFKLGILSDACTPASLDGPGGLKADLKAAGVTSFSEYRADCDITASQSAGSSALVRFRSDGVNHVFIAANTLVSQSFQSNAQSSGYKPTYLISDFDSITDNGSFMSFNNKSQFAGTKAASQWNTGDPLRSPLTKQCSAVISKAGLPPIQSYAKDIEAILLCENLDLFVRAARAAGAQLTRTSFSQAVGRLPAYAGAKTILIDFRGGVSGARGLDEVVYQSSCSCMVRTKRYR